MERQLESENGEESISNRSFRDSFATIEDINVDDVEAYEYQCGKLVIFCQPNASYYEVHTYDRGLINIFVKNGYTVVLWNYRGYAKSKGSPSMSVSPLNTLF